MRFNFGLRSIPWLLLAGLVVLLIVSRVRFSSLKSEAVAQIEAQTGSMHQYRATIPIVMIDDPVLMLSMPDVLFLETNDVHGLYDVASTQVVIAERKRPRNALQARGTFHGLAPPKPGEKIYVTETTYILDDIGTSAHVKQWVLENPIAEDTLEKLLRRNASRNEKAALVARLAVDAMEAQSRQFGRTLSGTPRARAFEDFLSELSDLAGQTRGAIETLESDIEDMAHRQRMELKLGLMKMEELFETKMRSFGWTPPELEAESNE